MAQNSEPFKYCVHVFFRKFKLNKIPIYVKIIQLANIFECHILQPNSKLNMGWELVDNGKQLTPT
jgi:hypothetical protein